MVCRFLSITLACLVLLSIGINVQTVDINAFRQNTMDNSYSYGKLRLNSDGNEELIPVNDGVKTMIPKNDQTISVQPLPTPCAGARPSTKLVHPTDKTKYIQCRDEFHYEIFHCPDNGEFDEQIKSCLIGTPIVDLCLIEKPCLNEGECAALPNSTFKCTCRADWTGDRCEIPLNTCATKPCGPLGECRPLKIANYQQDYVCVCRGRKEYGLNCQDVVPNPCTTGSDQYYPFAYNTHAYIQCDGEMLYIQPCGPMLYWNQEELYCDRKRPTTMNAKKLLKKTTVAPVLEYEAEPLNSITVIEPTTPVVNTIIVEQIKSTTPEMLVPMKEQGFRFVPTRVSNRPVVPETQHQGYSSAEFTPTRMRPVQQPVLRPDMQTVETTIRTPIIPSIRTNSWQSGIQSQRMEPLNIKPMQNDKVLIGTEEQQQVIPQPTQTYGSQQWNPQGALNQMNVQRFPTQSWQQNPSRGSIMETTTLRQPIMRSQGLPMRDQDQSQIIFTTTNDQFMPSADLRTSSLPTVAVKVPETTTLENRVRFTTDLPNQQQWQNPQMYSMRPVPPPNAERVFPDMQRIRIDQQWSTTTQSNIPIVEPTKEQMQMIPQPTQTYGSQQWNPQGALNQMNVQRFPTQSWQQNPSQDNIMETTTLGQNMFRQLVPQQPLTDGSEPGLRSRFMNQQTLNQPLVSQTNQWQEQRQPVNRLNNIDDSRTLVDASAITRTNTNNFINSPTPLSEQFLSNVPESTTVMNTIIPERSPVPSFNGWRAMRTNEQNQMINSGTVQQPIETRRTLDSIPSSWRNRM